MNSEAKAAIAEAIKLLRDVVKRDSNEGKLNSNASCKAPKVRACLPYRDPPSVNITPGAISRSYRSFSEAEGENADSRVLVGFHFRSSVEAGLKHGRKVGEWTVDQILQWEGKR